MIKDFYYPEKIIPSPPRQEMVTLYGGRFHGHVVPHGDMPAGLERIELSKPSVEDMFGGRFQLIEDPKERLFMGRPLYERETFLLQTYHIRAKRPNRFKLLRIGILEGTDLLHRELCEMQEAMRDVPWQFPPVSFLHEFDEWMSQTIFKITGDLTWKGRWVHPTNF